MLKVGKLFVDHTGAHHLILDNGEELACSLITIEDNRVKTMSICDNNGIERMYIGHGSITITLSVDVSEIEQAKTDIDINKAKLDGARLYTKKGYSLVDADGLNITGIESISLNISNKKRPESVTINYISTDDQLSFCAVTFNLKPISRNCYQLS